MPGAGSEWVGGGEDVGTTEEGKGKGLETEGMEGRAQEGEGVSKRVKRGEVVGMGGKGGGGV
jgi:hypothetical protein